jgi:pyruvate dehydrogenase E2 component (dihydrolipoamide acetyltransferase)
MAEIIKMPKLSDTMEEGVVAKWHKNIGDKVDDGELLAEIETDKATMEFESFQEGIILHHGVKEGEAGAINSILAIVGKKGEDISALLNDGVVTKEEIVVEEKAVEVKAASKTEIDTSNISATIIRMPKLSDTMKEGTVATWVKKVGDVVESGEVLAEIETDKATMEFESFEDGVLLFQGVAEGNSAEVDAVLAVIGEKGADYKLLVDSFLENNTKEKVEEIKVEKPVEIKTPAASSRALPVNNEHHRLKISPLAQKLAKEKGIDIQLLQGSGDGGRIIKRDIDHYQPVQTSKMNFASIGTEDYEEHTVSQMRKTIAKRLSESKFTAPHFYLTVDIDMENAMSARKAINAIPNTRVSFNDLVIKAAAGALKKHPAVNSSWLGDKIRVNNHVNVGVAVAVEDGLLVPVVRYADTKQLSSISAEVKDFAQRAKDKKLQPQDWEGSTFSISNLGMFGIEEFTAIVNPPNACILAVGAIRQTPVVKDGQVVAGNRMKVTLSCDHRVVDGASGSEFLQTFKMFLENPVTLLG